MKRKQPNAQRHFVISMWKSVIRILAGILLVTVLIPGAVVLNLLAVVGILFLIAEVIGIAEEMV